MVPHVHLCKSTAVVERILQTQWNHWTKCVIYWCKTLQSQQRIIWIKAKIIRKEKTVLSCLYCNDYCTSRFSSTHLSSTCYGFGHRFSATSQWKLSLARHLGKNLRAWRIQARHWSAVMSLQASSIAWRRLTCS